MESSDDEGDPAGTFFTKTSLLLSFLLTACYQPTQTTDELPQWKPETPVAVVEKAPEPAPVKKKPKKKKVYLTFDDGPNKGTRNVLHITRDEGVPVTFFIVGEHAFASSGQHATWDSLRIAEHIELCNHSYTHAHNRYGSFYERPDSVVADFQRAHDSLDLTNAVVRTPGRNIWRIDSIQYTDLKRSAAAADSLQQAGFIVMGWDLEWHYDHKTLSVTHAAEEVVAQIDSVFARGKTRHPDHLVLLAHDQVYHKPVDSFQLRQFLQLLKKKEDYELVLATAYPGANKPLPVDTARSKAPMLAAY